MFQGQQPFSDVTLTGLSAFGHDDREHGLKKKKKRLQNAFSYLFRSFFVRADVSLTIHAPGVVYNADSPSSLGPETPTIALFRKNMDIDLMGERNLEMQASCSILPVFFPLVISVALKAYYSLLSRRHKSRQYRQHCIQPHMSSSHTQLHHLLLPIQSWTS
jgi:hypothetical protein